MTTTTVVTTNKQLEDLRARLNQNEKDLEASLASSINDLKQEHDKKIQDLVDANVALVQTNEQQAERLRELEAAVFEPEGATTSSTTTTTTTTTTTATRKPTTPFDGASRAICNGQGNGDRCSPEVSSTGDGGLDVTSCCGDVMIHSQSCSVDPCKLQQDVEELKRKVP